jgi:[ribosomal protein S5]-alanine N-acetyltransferase
MSATPDLTLRTPRLRLRPLRVGDAQALFEMHSDARVMRYWSSPPWTSIEPAHAMVAMDLEGMPRGEHLRLGLELLADASMVGTCSLFHIVAASRRAEIGYVLRASAWGQGYMHEALQALLAHAFTTMQLNRLEADVDPRNAASARALERLGFTKEGHLRERWIVAGEVSDTALYGLLARTWQAAQ